MHYLLRTGDLRTWLRYMRVYIEENMNKCKQKGNNDKTETINL